MMSEKRFVCIDVGYGDDWYITDNGKRLSEMEIVDLLNEQQATIEQLQDLCGESDGENAKLRIENKRLEEENEQLKSARRDDAKEFSALFRQNFGLKRENEQLKKRR